ncbi:diguanylate cyclase domain-containing protein [Methylobacterium sp. JK268]
MPNTILDLKFVNCVLGFSPEVEARFEAETGADRVTHLRESIVIGLVFYNAYDLTNRVLMSDIIGLGFVLRLAVTAMALACAWLAGRVRPSVREALAAGGMLNAYALPVFLFWMTDRPEGAFTYAELHLTLVFGAMMLALRFPQALVFVAGAAAMTLLAVATKPNLSRDLVTAFTFQSVMAGLFVLVANYRVQRLSRLAFLASLRAIQRSDDLEEDRRRFAVLSHQDPLTGLLNRRSLDGRLAAWEAAPVGRRRALAAVMIDVDHFKAFNDRYGHPAGDACLRAVAAALRGELAGTGEAFRYGGEEFAVLLDLDETDRLQEWADRLRASVQALAIPHAGRGDDVAVVTASVGAALAPAGTACSPQALLGCADAALYDAKRDGRNRCRLCCAGPGAGAATTGSPGPACGPQVACRPPAAWTGPGGLDPAPLTL